MLTVVESRATKLEKTPNLLVHVSVAITYSEAAR